MVKMDVDGRATRHVSFLPQHWILDTTSSNTKETTRANVKHLRNPIALEHAHKVC